jgi:putative lipoic acid-binding regulatory protein
MSGGGGELLQFPCEFPIKVMGRDSESWRARTRAVGENQARPLESRRISERPSAKGNFIALTYTIEAQSRQQLDAIYQELTDSGVVLVAL